MKSRVFHLLLASSLLALASSSPMKKAAAAPAEPDIKNLSAREFVATIRGDYLLFLPEGYSPTGKKRWPLILFLHGAGERGTNVWSAAIHGPTSFIKNNPDFPFILVTPQCADGQKWSDAVVLGLLDAVMAANAVDTNRIYLTGLSMGGYGTWSLITTYPERFAAAAPICGGEGTIGALLSLGDSIKGPALRHLPIWAFHGAKDDVVPVGESERMVNYLKKSGVKDIRLTIYPQVTHNSWTQTYDNPELYKWFLSHKRGR